MILFFFDFTFIFISPLNYDLAEEAPGFPHTRIIAQQGENVNQKASESVPVTDTGNV